MDTKQEIITKICTKLQKLEGDSVRIEQIDVKKSNNRNLIGITIRTQESNVSPVFYIDEFVDKVCSGEMKVKEAVNKIFEEMHDAFKDLPAINEESVSLDREKILKNVVYRVVNAQRSSDFLQQMVHREFLDLSVVYSIIMKSDDDYTHSIPVTDRLSDIFGVYLDDLESAARKNTMKQGFSFTPLASIVGEDLGQADMYVITCGIPHISGASAILYPDCFQHLAEQLDSDLYIMPSSVQELLVAPVASNNRDSLVQMVREVNESTVLPELQLSDNLYKYSRKDNCITLA